jgi:hypothetical protein
LVQTFDEKLRLEINGVREKLAQLVHSNRLACLIEFGPRIPGTTRGARITSGEVLQPDWENRPILPGKAQEFWKTLLKRTARASWEPDEVTDAE